MAGEDIGYQGIHRVNYSPNQKVDVDNLEFKLNVDEEHEFVDGRFSNMKRVGYGGMANIYRVHDEERGEEIAVKMIYREVLNEFAYNLDEVEEVKRIFDRTVSGGMERNPVGTQLLLEEAQAADLLSNKGYVPEVFEVGRVDVNGKDGLVMLMELIKGKAFEVVKFESNVKQYKRIAEILDDMHKDNIAHGDFKPKAIMIEDGTERMVVVDFGSVLFERSSIDKQDLSGITPKFAYPYKREEGKYANVDKWSYAVMLYKAHIGRYPFLESDIVRSLLGNSDFTELFEPGSEFLDRFMSRESSEVRDFFISLFSSPDGVEEFSCIEIVDKLSHLLESAVESATEPIVESTVEPAVLERKEYMVGPDRYKLAKINGILGIYDLQEEGFVDVEFVPVGNEMVVGDFISKMEKARVVKHPNVRGVNSIVEIDMYGSQRAGYVMDKVDGDHLSEEDLEGYGIDLEDKLKALRGVANGVDILHESDIAIGCIQADAITIENESEEGVVTRFDREKVETLVGFEYSALLKKDSDGLIGDDRWAYAVLLYKSLFHSAPFTGLEIHNWKSTTKDNKGMEVFMRAKLEGFFSSHISNDFNDEQIDKMKGVFEDIFFGRENSKGVFSKFKKVGVRLLDTDDYSCEDLYNRIERILVQVGDKG